MDNVLFARFDLRAFNDGPAANDTGLVAFQKREKGVQVAYTVVREVD